MRQLNEVYNDQHKSIFSIDLIGSDDDLVPALKAMGYQAFQDIVINANW